MKNNKAQKKNASTIEKPPQVGVLRLLLVLSAILLSPLAGVLIIASPAFVPTMVKNIGWTSIYVDFSQNVHAFSVGDRDVELSVGTYQSTLEDPRLQEVDLDIISDGQLMPTLTYEYYMHPLSDRVPGAYRLKDVDGDRKKDFVIRMGSGEPDHKFYYISSKDGKGYQTDKTFQSSQPWSDKQFDESN